MSEGYVEKMHLGCTYLNQDNQWLAKVIDKKANTVLTHTEDWVATKEEAIEAWNVLSDNIIGEAIKIGGVVIKKTDDELVLGLKTKTEQSMALESDLANTHLTISLIKSLKTNMHGVAVFANSTTMIMQPERWFSTAVEALEDFKQHTDEYTARLREMGYTLHEKVGLRPGLEEEVKITEGGYTSSFELVDQQPKETQKKKQNKFKLPPFDFFDPNLN